VSVGSRRAHAFSHWRSIRGTNEAVQFGGLVLFLGVCRVKHRTLLLIVLVDQDNCFDILLFQVKKDFC